MPLDETWITNMEKMHKVVMGNGNPEKGLFSIVSNLKKDLSWNTRLTWAIFAIILSTAVKVIFWGI